MLAVAKLYADREGNVNQRSLYDVGLAVGTLSVQATAHGLVVHQMGGFHGDKAREVFGLPEGYEPVAAIALGYPGDPNTLPEDLRDRELAPRTRKPLADFVFSGEWGLPTALVLA
jgi:nitroreductase